MNTFIPMMTLGTLGVTPFLFPLLAFIYDHDRNIRLGCLVLLALAGTLLAQAIALYYIDYPPVCTPICIALVLVFYGIVVWLRCDCNTTINNLLQDGFVRFYGIFSLLFILPNLYLLFHYWS